MDLRQAFTWMQAAGILMRARGDRLSVASRAPLTDQQRTWIRAHKVELLRLLGGAVSASPKPTAEDQEANAGRAAGCGPDGGPIVTPDGGPIVTLDGGPMVTLDGGPMVTLEGGP